MDKEKDFKIYNVIGFIEGRIDSFDDSNPYDAVRISENKKILEHIRRIYNINKIIY